ncbi:MAG: hypothetical protein Q9M43_07080 [Sulfurimonas sp.]|nr:hypothetical protein [Sulfurimonas sp.]
MKNLTIVEPSSGSDCDFLIGKFGDTFNDLGNCLDAVIDDKKKLK